MYKASETLYLQEPLHFNLSGRSVWIYFTEALDNIELLSKKALTFFFFFKEIF